MNYERVLRHLQMLILAVLMTTFISSVSYAASYYVDSINGNDGNPGTQAAPWKSVTKVNGFALRPGDSVNFICGGSWDTLLNPASGASGSPVTYQSYGSGNKPLIRGFYAANKSYVNVRDIEFRNNSSDAPALLYNGTNHVILQDCDIIADSSNSSYVALWLSTNVSYNQILNCKVEHRNVRAQNDTINLRLNANYNLIQGNTILSGTHYGLTLEGSTASYPSYTCSYNVIAENTINAAQGAAMELQSNANRNVIQGNIMHGGLSNSYNVNLPRSFKSVSMNNIIRYNIVRDNLDPNGSGLSTEVYQYASDPPNIATGNHIYNNVITNNAQYPIVISTNGSSGTSVYNNYYKNNIVSNNPANYALWIMRDSTISNNYFNNNVFYKSGASNILNVQGLYTSVAGIQSSDPTHFSGNLQVDPQLDGNYNLSATSPVIDKGAFLTTVTSASGSGTSFTVADAGYFSNGFGVTAGDTIVVGGASATISSINYSTNVITVTASISWTQGAKVSLPYSGSAPDMGAFEYSTTLTPPLNLRAS